MELRGTIPLEQRQRYMWLDVTAPSGGDCARCWGARYWLRDGRCRIPLPRPRVGRRQAVPDTGFEACAHSARVLEQKTLDSTRKCIPLSSK